MFICPLDVNILTFKIMGVYPDYFSPTNESSEPQIISPDPFADVTQGSLTEQKSSDSLQQKILDSSNYKKAYEIFSADARYGRPYLAQLELIPGSYQSAERTGLDNINWSNRADDKDYANFNHAMTEIRNLVNNYYTFINSLPRSQVSQSIEAGYNLGLLGGINGSSMNELSSSPSVANEMPSTQPLEQISSAIATGIDVVTGITSAVSGIAGVYKAFKDVSIARDSLGLQTARLAFDEASFVNTMVKSLVDNGFEIDVDSVKSVDDLNKFLSFASIDPISQGVREGKLTTWYKNVIENTPYKAYLSYDENGVMSFSPEKLFVDAGKKRYPDKTPQEIMELYAQYKMDAHLLGIEKDKFTALFEYEYASSIDGEQAGEAFNAQNIRTEVEEGYKTLENDLKDHYLRQYADMFKTTDDPAVKFAVLQVLYDMGINEQSDAEVVKLLGSSALTKVFNENYQNVAGQILKRLDPNRYQDKMLKILDLLK